MRWKKASDTIVAVILSIAYTIVTLMNIIGPLHITDTGGVMNPLGSVAVYSIIFWVFALIITWGVYFYLRKKPGLIYFILIAIGIVLIILEVFLWGWLGS